MFNSFLFDNTETKVLEEEESEMDLEYIKYRAENIQKYGFLESPNGHPRSLEALTNFSYCYHSVCTPACQHFCVR